jgi:hypothetical protein
MLMGLVFIFCVLYIYICKLRGYLKDQIAQSEFLFSYRETSQRDMQYVWTVRSVSEDLYKYN